MSNSNLYERDFYAWANEQAALLRANQLGQADIENIAEEIESMGRGEKREWVSRLTVLLLHLLKWHYQPALRGASWRSSIRVQRISIDSHMQDNPSLKAVLPAAIAEAYRVARIEAEDQPAGSHVSDSLPVDVRPNDGRGFLARRRLATFLNPPRPCPI